jgi:hypothetical protein
MKDNVISLNGGLTGEKQVVTSTVEQLEVLLEAAKSGQIVGIAYSVLEYDNNACFGVVGRVGGFGMVGALEAAKLILTDANIDGN